MVLYESSTGTNLDYCAIHYFLPALGEKNLLAKLLFVSGFTYGMTMAVILKPGIQ
jgi:hypothetical protein